jgi:lysophospholipase L1-like esterase
MKQLKIILLLLTLFAIVSCRQKSNEKMNTNTENTEKPAVFKYLALGDSYTIGESVEADERFPALLTDSLVRRYDIVIDYEIIAKTGWTTRQLLAAIEMEAPEPSYNLVTLLIGVNNQYRKRDTAEYRTEFCELLQKAISFAGNKQKRVIVISIPDYGVTPFAENMNSELIAEEINAFNAINFEETKKSGAHYLDITGISRMAADDPSLLAGDGLHPSPIMYRLWVDAMFPVIEDIFNP